MILIEVVQRFQELFAQTKYKEAAELAAEYFGTLLTRGNLNAFESLELSRLVVNQNKKNLLENYSEELGDLVKTALKIFIKARVTHKVVVAFAERRKFGKILIYSKQESIALLLQLII